MELEHITPAILEVANGGLSAQETEARYLVMGMWTEMVDCASKSSVLLKANTGWHRAVKILALNSLEISFRYARNRCSYTSLRLSSFFSIIS